MSETPTQPVIDMLIDGTWVDLVDEGDVRLSTADSGGGIGIKRGRPNESPISEPTELGFTINNAGGKYSLNNPNSIYWGQLGRNQPVRCGLNRHTDDFARTVSAGWGSMSDGSAWTFTTADPTAFNVGSGVGTIQATTGERTVTMGMYGDVDITAKMKVSNRTSEFGLMARVRPLTIAFFDFEAGLGTWYPVGGTLVSSGAQFHSGALSALFTVSGSPSIAYARQALIAIDPGTSYQGASWVRCSATRTVTAAIDWYTSAGVYISTASADTAVTADTWTRVTASGAAPSNAAFALVGPTLNSSPANGTTLYIDDVTLLQTTQRGWYSGYITPDTGDHLRIGVISPWGVVAYSQALGFQVVVDTYYWFHMQVTGSRIRISVWADGDPEPTSWMKTIFDDQYVNHDLPPVAGPVGFLTKDGTALVTCDSFTAVEWRAHAEVSELPVKFDLSRQDRWVPIEARGILRRLGQGRKALKSAVTRHLTSYASSAMWIPLEKEGSSTRASSNISNGRDAIVNNISYSSDENIPGLEGFAQVVTAGASINAAAISHAATTVWTHLMFVQVPNVPSTAFTLVTLFSTGTARTWKMVLGSDSALTITALAQDGSTLSSDSVLLYFADIPAGSWIAMTLYLFDSGGNVNWAFNFHRPGSSNFYTSGTNTFTGKVGNYRSTLITADANSEAAGGINVGQLFHYPGDLPFVTDAFAKAANAYIGEVASIRFLRLCSEMGIRASWFGANSAGTQTMGPQRLKKLLELLEECADAGESIMVEERGEFGLSLYYREAVYNQRALTMDIDEGHLSEPLEGIPDDQGTRNDVTVTRPLGGFAVSIAETGPLNVNEPEDDPQGVGTYDEAPELNLSTDAQLQPAANWRRSKGTIDKIRYPDIHADLTAVAYQSDSAFAAAVRSIDSGMMLSIVNPEESPDASLQVVQSYTETIDQYDYDIHFVATPGDVYVVGVVGVTTRVGTAYSEVQTTFIAGTHTSLIVQRSDATKGLWVLPADSAASFPFLVKTGGVVLNVTSISGTGDPQTLTVDQTPVNGIVKTVPVGEPVVVFEPWRLAW
jgi:hypothetical protein